MFSFQRIVDPKFRQRLFSASLSHAGAVSRYCGRGQRGQRHARAVGQQCRDLLPALVAGRAVSGRRMRRRRDPHLQYQGHAGVRAERSRLARSAQAAAADHVPALPPVQSGLKDQECAHLGKCGRHRGALAHYVGQETVFDRGGGQSGVRARLSRGRRGVCHRGPRLQGPHL